VGIRLAIDLDHGGNAPTGVLRAPGLELKFDGWLQLLDVMRSVIDEQASSDASERDRDEWAGSLDSPDRQTGREPV
jgi:hypothetical protein